MLIVVALGGNALLRRGEPVRGETQVANIRAACNALAPLAADHQLVITHGNGPQVGLLAMRDTAADFPLDVHDAESEGMIGYLIERELGNLLRPKHELAALLTMVEVDPTDPAFKNPTKPIGALYPKAEAERLAKRWGWRVKADGDGYRRVVASPEPQRIVEIEPVRWLLERGSVVICTGGGGIPVARTAGNGLLQGIAAVIDKDIASSLLASNLDADFFLMATDVDGVYLDWGAPTQHRVHRADPTFLRRNGFAEGSMGPKIEAACRFVEQTSGTAAIGALEEIAEILNGQAGTTITSEDQSRPAVGSSSSKVSSTGP
jgi:carbamate kinase